MVCKAHTDLQGNFGRGGIRLIRKPRSGESTVTLVGVGMALELPPLRDTRAGAKSAGAGVWTEGVKQALDWGVSPFDRFPESQEKRFSLALPALTPQLAPEKEQPLCRPPDENRFPLLSLQRWVILPPSKTGPVSSRYDTAPPWFQCPVSEILNFSLQGTLPISGARHSFQKEHGLPSAHEEEGSAVSSSKRDTSPIGSGPHPYDLI